MRSRAAFGRARGLPARLLLRGFGVLAGGRAVPVDVVRAVRRIGVGPDPLVGRPRPVDGGFLDIADLGEQLKGVKLGTWALGPRSLRILVEMVATHRPGLIIEFGSGASTVALAWAIHSLQSGAGGARVVSLEQDEDHAQRTRDLLARAGLQDEAVVIVAPLTEQTIEGVRTTCYAMPRDFARVLDGRTAGLVVIDGPAAAPGARFGTLPLVRPYVAEGASFVLDDALRDGELGIARRWRPLSYIRVDGIRLIEKGLLTGTVRCEPQADS